MPDEVVVHGGIESPTLLFIARRVWPCAIVQCVTHVALVASTSLTLYDSWPPRPLGTAYTEWGKN